MENTKKNDNDIINLVINHINKIQKNKCKHFNIEHFASFIDNNLSVKETIRYKHHISQCPYCSSIYNNLVNEIKILKQTKIKKISKDLLNEALDIIDAEYQQKSQDTILSKILIKLKEKGMELQQAVNCLHLKPSPIPSLRSKQKDPSTCFKEISIKNEFRKHEYTILIQYHSNNTFTLQIIFSDQIYNQIKDERLFIKADSSKINKNIKKGINAFELEKGKYNIYINKDPLFKLEAI